MSTYVYVYLYNELHSTTNIFPHSALLKHLSTDIIESGGWLSFHISL